MTDFPHASQFGMTTGNLARIVKAYLREHDMPESTTRMTVELCNDAIGWWNSPDRPICVICPTCEGRIYCESGCPRCTGRDADDWGDIRPCYCIEEAP